MDTPVNIIKSHYVVSLMYKAHALKERKIRFPILKKSQLQTGVLLDRCVNIKCVVAVRLPLNNEVPVVLDSCKINKFRFFEF